MSSDGSLEIFNHDNLEGIVSGTEYDIQIRQGPDGEFLGITHVASYISKYGGSSTRKALGAEEVIEGEFSNGIPDVNIVVKFEIYRLVASLGSDV